MQEFYTQLQTITTTLLDYHFNLSFFFWLSTAGLLLMIELGHPGLFYFLSFSLGAFGAAGMALAGCSFTLQLGFLLIASTIAWVMLRTWVKREQQHNYRSNVYALQGREGVVVVTIPKDGLGQVSIDGELWRAQTHDGAALEEAVRVRVLQVRGTRVIVQKIEFYNQ